MSPIAIPRTLAQKDDLVVVPRKEYEALLEFRNYREVSMTKAQKQALLRAEKNMRIGKTLSYRAGTYHSAVNEITLLNSHSRSFGFLKDEPELYSGADLKERYA